MTPNIHAHYTDHGQLQFCSVILEDNVEINFGATIMPLTQYQTGCRLRPHAVTVKGQICESGHEYFGNPCKADMSTNMLEFTALLFPGQGSVSLLFSSISLEPFTYNVLTHVTFCTYRMAWFPVSSCTQQYPGMLDKVKHLQSVQKVLHTANDILGYDVLKKSDVGATDINDTMYAQPLMLVAGLAHAEVMKQKHPMLFTKVKAVAGFSLGEITALCYAGAFSLEDALRLVKARAEAMAKCNGGAMCNVIGMSHQEVKSLCKRTGCAVANIICNHDQKGLVQHNIFVCAGTLDGIDTMVKEIDAVKRDDGENPKSKKLRVSGAFHSKAMNPARAQLDKVLGEINISLPTDTLVYSNVTGQPYQSVKEIRQNLSRHIVEPVLWHDTIQSLSEEENVTTFIECGPQKVLSKVLQAYLKCQSDEESQSGTTVLTSDL